MSVPPGVTARLMVRGPSGVDAASIGEGPFVVGRDLGAALVLDGPGVSRRHCVIEPAGAGRHRVRDLESTNGLFVNDRRASCAWLEPFDRIRVGEVVLVYLDAAQDVDKLRAALAPLDTTKLRVATRAEARLDQLVWLTLMVQDARGCRDLAATVDTLLDDLAHLSGGREARALVLLEQDDGLGPELSLAPLFGAALDAPTLDACRALARRVIDTGETCEGTTPAGANALCISMRELPRQLETTDRRRTPERRRPRGALVLVSRPSLALSVAEAALLEALARQLAVLICRERLEHHAAIDALTGLHTRAWLAETLTRELDASPAALLLLDVDDFKAVNDAHGHAAGDEVLRAVGERVRAVIRETDLAGRWGGDELLVALPGADRAGAERVAGALVDSLAREPIGRRRVRASISVGVALSPLHATGLPSLLRCADSALYAAKRAGKGRVEVYAPEKRAVPLRPCAARLMISMAGGASLSAARGPRGARLAAWAASSSRRGGAG